MWQRIRTSRVVSCSVCDGVVENEHTDARGEFIHETCEQERRPVRIQRYVRAYCRMDKHAECTGMHLNVQARRGYVCMCECHDQ